MQANLATLSAIVKLLERPLDQGRADKVDRLLNATMEGVADTLPTMTAKEMRAELGQAARASALLHSGQLIDRLSPAFMAGRLAAVIDILGYAESATADETAVGVAGERTNAQVLGAIADGKLTPAEIARVTGREEPATRATLAELCCAQLVARFPRGATHEYKFTPLGRIVAGGDSGRAELRH